MRLPKLNVRTLLIVVAATAVLLELVGLGHRSRKYAAEASRAGELEQSSIRIARDVEIYAAEILKEAERIVARDPDKAAKLRLDAERSIRNVSFRKELAVKAAKARESYERAVTHPWEDPPKEDGRLYATPAAGSP